MKLFAAEDEPNRSGSYELFFDRSADAARELHLGASDPRNKSGKYPPPRYPFAGVTFRRGEPSEFALNFQGLFSKSG